MQSGKIRDLENPADLNEEELALIEEEKKAFLDLSYNTYESTAQCINKSIKWRNCHIVDVDLILDHNEHFY